VVRDVWSLRSWNVTRVLGLARRTYFREPVAAHFAMWGREACEIISASTRPVSENFAVRRLSAHQRRDYGWANLTKFRGTIGSQSRHPTKAFINGNYTDAASGQTFDSVTGTGSFLLELPPGRRSINPRGERRARCLSKGVWSNLAPSSGKRL